MTARAHFEKICPLAPGICYRENVNGYVIGAPIFRAEHYPNEFAMAAQRQNDRWQLFQSLYPQIEAGMRLREAFRRMELDENEETEQALLDALDHFDAVGVV
jgi:hypothetical protein